MSERVRTFWDWVGLSGFAGASMLVVGFGSDAAGQTGGAAVLVYAPWTSGADAIARAGNAGAQPIRAGRFGFVVLAQPTTSGLTARDAGAWMMLDAAGLGGCLSGAPEAIYAAAR